MSRIAIIPARGGSKRIPYKNIRNFCGKPIIAYSIETAINCGLFDEVMVSTDDSMIAEVAKKYGASVPFYRSNRSSDDNATIEDAIIEVLDEYKKIGREFDIVCCIFATAPFVTNEKLEDALELLSSHLVDSVIPVVRYSFPPQRAMIKRGEYIEYIYPENNLKRSQDLVPIYHDCGQFYMCKESALRSYRDVVSPKCISVEMPENEVQDIDNESDWILAELKYSYMLKNRNK